MNRHETEQAIARDLATADLVQAVMPKRSRQYGQAAKHRAACMSEISRMNEADGLADMSDDELLSALGV